MTAETLIRALTERRLTIATCESLTGGMICSTLVDVPGASWVVRGGLVTYQTEVKTLLAGVDAALIQGEGVVSAAVAKAMAQGARERLQADIALSATGMASPGGPDEPPCGTVFVGVASAKGVRAIGLHLTGDRQAIRQQTVNAALSLAMEELALQV